MSSSSGVGNGARGHGIVRRCGGRGGRSIGRGGLGGRGSVLEDPLPLRPGLHFLSYGPPWAHYLSGYQDRLLGGPLGLLDLRCTTPVGVKRKDLSGEVLG
jgi:hypothetical protein